MAEEKNSLFRKIAGRLSVVTARKKAAIGFAKKHGLIYFDSVDPDNTHLPIVLGSTASLNHVDGNVCIGTHAGYDMALIERLSSIAHPGYKTAVHRWYVMQIDLQNARGLPYIFIGTRQQSKAYYAKLLNTHRQLRHLSMDTAAKFNATFHGSYAVLASSADASAVYRLLTDDTIDTIAAHRHPFAVEIEGDNLMVITEATKPSQQLLDKLLHYGLWLAKEIDQRFD